MIYGLAAALGWGLSDLWAAISGRRIGSGRTVVVAQVTAAIVVSLLVLVVRPDLSGIPTVAPWLVPNAFLGAAAFATLYKGLQLGPIAVVSPVLASYAVVPVLLSVVLLGETLGGVEVAGVVVTIAGAALTSTDPKALRAGNPNQTRGPVLGDRVDVAVRRRHLRDGLGGQGGRVPAVALVREADDDVRLPRRRTRAVAAFAFGRPEPAIPSPGRCSGSPSWSGVMELVGTISYARGAEVGLVSIVTAASATYPLIRCWAVSSSCTSARSRPSTSASRW